MRAARLLSAVMAGALAVGGLALMPGTAQADGWHGRGHGWGHGRGDGWGPPRHWHRPPPPPVYYAPRPHWHRPPPPPVYYAPRPYYYRPPPPPVYYAPPPGIGFGFTIR